MRVLFVYKGSGKELRNSIVDAQFNSIKSDDVELLKFPLATSGIGSYYKEFLRLKKFIKTQKIDLIHAHYSYSGIIAALTGKKTICSLMGSDIFAEYWFVKPITRFFYKFVWVKTIVKSKLMQEHFKNSVILPNGVDFDKFKPIPKKESILKTSLDPKNKNIIFIAEHIHRKVKNFDLAEKAVQLLPDEYKLNPVSGVTQDELVNYYNAADVLLLTSLSEGSPNVVKEAMSVNCPVVSTDVGDVREVITNTDGCYVTTFNPEDIAGKIKKAVEYGQKRTEGRKNIAFLDKTNVSKQIVDIYKNILSNN